MQQFLLVGYSQSGKTSLLKNLIAHAEAAHIRLAGMICPAIFEDGEKIGISLELLPEKTHVVLAHKDMAAWNQTLAQIKAGTHPDFTGHNLTPKEQAVQAKQHWQFDDNAMALADQHFANLQLGAPEDAPEIAIIDEVGPLELSGRGGILSALSYFAHGPYGACVMTMRPALVDEAQRRWPRAKVVDLADVDAIQLYQLLISTTQS